MKAKYILPIAAGLILTFTSCNREEENIWPESAASRLEKVTAEQAKILCEAPNGWSLYYYAPKSTGGGVNFTMQFSTNGSVTIGTRNQYNATSYGEEVSMWEILTDNGPVLSFNSYNTYFHYFSDPDQSVAGGTQGVGFGGDYEFMIMNYSKDSITLKGKKTGVYCKMFPLEADATGDAYFDKLDAFESTLFNSNLPYIWFEAENGDRYTAAVKTGTNTIDFIPEGGDALFETITVPYVMTNTGINFPEPFEGDSEKFSVSNFDYNADNTTLICREDGKSKFTAGNLNKFFIINGQNWGFDSENPGEGAIATAIAELYAQCTTLKFNMQTIGIGYNAEQKQFAFTFKLKSGKKTYRGNFFGKFEAADDALTISIDKDNCDANAKTLSKSATKFYDIVEALNAASPFEVQSESSLNPSKVKLVSKANANSYIILNSVSAKD